jgi:hypothetical protein
VIKLLLKLAIVALLANAAFHIGAGYLTYFKFRDAIRDAAMFKAKNEAELMTRVMELAEQYEVPLDEENLVIERDERLFHIDGWYDQAIEVAPNYFYPWHFGFALEAVKPATYAVTP